MEGNLPSVDWSKILLAAMNPSKVKDLQASTMQEDTVLRFVFKHATGSRSMTSYLLQILPVVIASLSLEETATNMWKLICVEGIAVVTRLAADGAISVTKWTGVLQVFQRALFAGSMESEAQQVCYSEFSEFLTLQYFQRMFLENLVETISAESSGSGSSLSDARTQFARMILHRIPPSITGHYTHYDSMIFHALSLANDAAWLFDSLGQDDSARSVLCARACLLLKPDALSAKSYQSLLLCYITRSDATASIVSLFLESFYECMPRPHPPFSSPSSSSSSSPVPPNAFFALLDELLAKNPSDDIKLRWLEWVVGGYCSLHQARSTHVEAPTSAIAAAALDLKGTFYLMLHILDGHPLRIQVSFGKAMLFPLLIAG